jgi:hypothetical protein
VGQCRYNYEQMAKGKGGSQMASEMNRGPSDIAFLYAKPPGTEMVSPCGVDIKSRVNNLCETFHICMPISLRSDPLPRSESSLDPET